MEIEGIVIRTSKFRDYDLMVNVLSHDKIYSFLARGVLRLKSKNAGSLNPLSLSNFNLMRTKEGLTLKEGNLIFKPNGRDDLNVLAVFDFILEITSKLIGNDDAINIYPYLKKTIYALDDNNNNPFSIALFYLAKVLDIAGYGLDVDECVLCGNRSEISAVSYDDGGFTCKNCLATSNSVKYSKRELQILRYIFKVDENKFLDVNFNKEESLKLMSDLGDFVQNNAGFKIISLNLLKKI